MARASTFDNTSSIPWCTLRRMHRWMGFAVLAVVACGGPKGTGVEPRGTTNNGTSTADAERCAAEVDGLRAWLEQLIESGVDLSLARTEVEMVRLDSSAEVERLERLPVVTVGQRLIAFNGETMADVAAVAGLPEGSMIDELHHRLLAEREQQCTSFAAFEAGLTLHIDRRASWRAIRAVTDTIYGSRYDRVVVAFEGPVVVAPPAADPEIADAVTAWEAQVFAPGPDSPPVTAPHPVEVAWGECDALVEATEKLGVDDRTALLRALPDAAASCDCGVPANNVKAIVWWWTGRTDSHRSVGVEITLAATGAERRIVEADDAAIWSDAHAALRGAGPIALSAPGSSPAADALMSRPVDTCW